MKQQFFLTVALVLAGCSSAMSQTFTEWHDLHVNEVNRFPMHTHFFGYESVEKALKGDKNLSKNYLSIEGDWQFKWVENADERPTDFYQTDLDVKDWTTMKIPAVWELNGFGDPEYVNIGFAWRGHFENNPPMVPIKDNHVGSYRRWIDVPQEWKGRQTIIHFGSVTSNIYLYVNGKFVGYAEDSKVAAEFDVTPYLIAGKRNLIAFQTFRWCDGSYCEDQDFWRLSGVARECYLYSRDAKTHLDDIRINADLTNNYQDGLLNIQAQVAGKANLWLELLDANQQTVWAGKYDGKPVVVKNPHRWTAETPYLYTLVAKVIPAQKVAKGKGKAKEQAKEVEAITQKVGFRKVEIKNKQLLVNGQPILVKGVDRHELDPDGGYVVSVKRMIEDIKVLKRFNINAVRTCHYPDDPRWYELCDQYGIYLVAEANQEAHGFGYEDDAISKTPLFEQVILERNQHNVKVYYNHPSIITWSMGNETVDGPNFTVAYNWIKTQDLSRPVQYERTGRGPNTDIFCPMYVSPEDCERYLTDPKADRPLIQCEYSHAMGNSSGGFKEYWELIRKYPMYQGGFIWDFADQALHGKDGMYKYGGDYNDYDPSDNNFNCNGLFSPDRVASPQAYEVQYFYQNVWAEAVNLSKGVVSVHNEFFFRDLSNVKMVWSLESNGVVMQRGEISSLGVAPQQTREYTLPVNAEGKLLNIEFLLKQPEPLMAAGQMIAHRQLGQETPVVPVLAAGNEKKAKLVLQKGDNEITIAAGKTSYTFSKNTGLMTSASMAEDKIPVAMKPNFWRAVNDNDMGAEVQKEWKVWRNPELQLVSLNTNKDKKNGRISVEAVYNLPQVQATLTMNYCLKLNGSMDVTMNLKTTEGAEVPNMLRYGVIMQLPYEMDRSQFYGRGPVENYADRKESQRFGIYRQTADEQFYPYIRPQETGLKSDISWWKQTNSKDMGFLVTAEKLFYASALHYDQETLDEGEEKGQRHIQQVPKSHYTNLFIDGEHSGVGGFDSWGALPLEKYRIKYGDKTLRFTLTPLHQ